MTDNQICIKCKKSVPTSEFQPLASGKGFYKKCKTCAPVAGEKKKGKVEKEKLLLLANFDVVTTGLRKSYESSDAAKILEFYSNFNDINIKLQALSINK